MTAIGATSSFPTAPAKVCLLNPQPALKLGGGNCHFAPKRTLTVSARTAESDGKRALPICIAAAGSSQERPFARGVQSNPSNAGTKHLVGLRRHGGETRKRGCCQPSRVVCGALI